IAGVGPGDGEQLLSLLRREFARQHDAHLSNQITGRAALRLNTMPADAEPFATGSPRRNRQRDGPLRSRDLNLGPLDRFGQRDRECDLQLIAATAEVRVWGDLDENQDIPLRPAVRVGLPLASNAD